MKECVLFDEYLKYYPTHVLLEYLEDIIVVVDLIESDPSVMIVYALKYINWTLAKPIYQQEK
jgi:hypothetical protein